MRILRVYARVFVDDLPTAVAANESLLGRPAGIRFDFGGAHRAAIGELLLISGPAAVTDGFRGTTGPILVADLAEARAAFERNGGVLTGEPVSGPTGSFFHTDIPGGGNLEVVQWTDVLVARILGDPEVRTSTRPPT